jgi:hypothetical protein
MEAHKDGTTCEHGACDDESRCSACRTKYADDILVRLAAVDSISQRDRATIRDAMHVIASLREADASMRNRLSEYAMRELSRLDEGEAPDSEIARLTAERDEANRALAVYREFIGDEMMEAAKRRAGRG